MTETADQVLSHVVPVCQWAPQNSLDSSSTASAYPLFPDDVREWIQFFRGVRLTRIQYPLPGGQFPVFPTITEPLEIEKDAEDRFKSNVLSPVDAILETQGAIFYLAKMPVEMKTRFNLNLCGHHLWTIYRRAQRNQIMIADHNFKFKKKILSQMFGAMACNGLHYGILSNYNDTYFFKREETNQTTLYVSRVVKPNDANPTLRECTDISKKVVASSSKRITTIDKYIGRGTFGNVFSGYYHGQAVAWKTCEAYKEKEAKKTLRIETNMYSILRNAKLLYEGYIYDGYLYALVLQLIEDARHIDPENLTVGEKRTIVQQLETIHSYGVLHNDIAQRNILMEPKSRRFFFIDFGLMADV
ncbi:11473_t:CDS:2 [Diversispora eburnea]|uniref:11473_t:CDS:1 n=1 Tax=Diversispora eburnea TaxID=1213867 RepID=A0A9N9ADX9_9GLOM|nr:11473_t:CDS:2 [Diversispora eburnea]